MGSRAKISKFAVAVERYRLRFGNICQASHLITLLLFFKKSLRLSSTHLFPYKSLFFLDHFLHLRLDLRKILIAQSMGHVEIIVKPCIGRRSDIQKRLGPKPQNRGGQHVCRRVTEFFERSHHSNLGGSRLSHQPPAASTITHLPPCRR